MRISTAALAGLVVLVLAGCAEPAETAVPPTTAAVDPTRTRIVLTQRHEPGQPGGPLLLGPELLQGAQCYSFAIDKTTFLSVEGSDGDVIATASIGPGIVAQIDGDAWNCWWRVNVSIPKSGSYAILVDGEVRARHETIDRTAGLVVALDVATPAPGPESEPEPEPA